MTKSELRQIIREEISKVSKENISSFLTANKQELLSKLAKKFQSYRGEENKANRYKIELADIDPEVAILTQSGMSVGLDFSFNPSKFKGFEDEEGEQFKLVVAGKTVYGSSYNM